MSTGYSRVVLYEDCGWTRLLPLVYTRPVFQLLCGMDTLWDTVRGIAGDSSREVAVRESLAELTGEKLGCVVNRVAAESTLFLNGRGRWRRLPTPNEPPLDGVGWVGLGDGGRIACIAASPTLSARLTPSLLLDEAGCREALAELPRRDISNDVRLFDWPWQLVHANADAIVEDTGIRGLSSIAGRLDEGVHLLNRTEIHVGQGSRIKPCVVLDAENGPIWIGDNVRIQPHCYVEGPAYIGDGTLLQPGAVIRGGASVGPVCKVGGEVEGSVLVGYSNKQHDGFLGHSYVGSFVNIAADCINSDLKNTYGTVRVPINGYEVDSGEQFVGLTVGDHAKAGINVGFPTGAVVGFCSSVVGPMSPKFVPSFAWVDDGRWERYDAERGLAIARKVMTRRGLAMTAAEERAFLAVRGLAAEIERSLP